MPPWYRTNAFWVLIALVVLSALTTSDLAWRLAADAIFAAILV